MKMASEQAAADAMSDSYRGMSSDNIKGLILALSSSFFIGASFIVKKKGLKKAGASGVRAGNSHCVAIFILTRLFQMMKFREFKCLTHLFRECCLIFFPI